MHGNQADLFNSVDEALRLSETIPGEYEYSNETSYGQVEEINEGDSAYFDIKCDRFSGAYSNWTTVEYVSWAE